MKPGNSTMVFVDEFKFVPDGQPAPGASYRSKADSSIADRTAPIASDRYRPEADTRSLGYGAPLRVADISSTVKVPGGFG